LFPYIWEVSGDTPFYVLKVDPMEPKADLLTLALGIILEPYAPLCGYA